jgi:Na+/proline symporter/signal transduction histidine kinase/CheY-like chemotaxis protein
MPLWLVFAALALYAGLLFFLAHWGEQRSHQLPPAVRRLVYALALIVYCTSWTFFGAVGTASEAGWEYLAIYLGPMLTCTLGLPLLTKLVRVGREQQVTSIASFLAARYGKSNGLAAAVTLIATLGALPYIALQLKAVSTSLTVLTRDALTTSAVPNDAYVLVVALTLAAFAVLFGTRHSDVTRPNRGMMLALAAQSLFKLAALVAVASFAALMLIGLQSGSGTSVAAPAPPWQLSANSVERFLTLTLLGGAALLCLPRQFHVMVVECEDANAIRLGALVIVAAMLIVSMVVLPIAALGKTVMAGGTAPALVEPDLLVLALPMLADQQWLALVAFLGGFAAATSMVIVATVALSLMISHDLVAPLLVQGQLRGGASPDPRGASLTDYEATAGRAALGGSASYGSRHQALLPARLLLIRQLIILGLMLLAFLHYLAIDKSAALSGLGVRSFAAVAQFLPILVGGLYWKRGHRYGAWAGLLGGAFIWAWWFAGADVPDMARPALNGLGLGNIDPLTVGVVLSLSVNALAYVVGSVLARPTHLDRQQALAFTAGGRAGHGDVGDDWSGSSVTVGDLRTLLVKVLGEDAADAAIGDYQRLSGQEVQLDDMAARDFVAHQEAALARVVGASSARILLRSAARGERLPTGDVLTLIDETSQKIQDSQRALEESERSMRFYLDNVPALIIFVRADEQVAFANRAYRDLFERDGVRVVGNYASHYLSAEEYAIREPYIREVLQGRRVQFDITVTMNDTPGMALRPEGTSRAPDMTPIASAAETPDSPETPDGRTIYFQVTYVPQRDDDGGLRGFFGLYQDVTARKAAERALRETNESLEQRVRSRTAALSTVNEALRQAREEAEQATRSKTRFLAAASHDLLQPLNAARLFTSALQESVRDEDVQTVELTESIDRSIRSADRLLRALLDISKLDAGGLKPDLTTFTVNVLLEELANEFARPAAEKGLEYHWVPCSLSIRSDRGLLLSVLQNLVSNAIRYTDKGRVLVGARRRGDCISLQVWDTGRGIPPDKTREIFGEFHRLDRDTRLRDSGVGLGLAITDRITRLLEHPLSLNSREGEGSCFRLDIPVAAPAMDPRKAMASTGTGTAPDRVSTLGELAGGGVVWCVDNDPDVLAALAALLARWGYTPNTAKDMDEVAAWLRSGKPAPDVVLLDFQLDHGETGFDVLDLMMVHGCRPSGVAMMTAVANLAALKRRAAERGITVMRKPVDPAALRAFMARIVASGGALSG